ncbi:hypothetical protein BJV77DRAFT_438366 [Russula vinacea]|nr:hypothetical protein BJV77DRAFT_438366 [Russula vinacea]
MAQYNNCCTPPNSTHITMSTDIPLSNLPQGQHGLTSLGISEGNTQDDTRQQRSMPLGVALTGNLLFTISWIVGLGIPKAVYANSGQSLISPTLDWVGGIIFTLISLFLGVIDAKRPELCPNFFEVDWAPDILEFVCRHDVHLWFASVLPLILAVETRLLEEKTKQALVGSHFVSNTAIPRSVVDYTACLYIHPLGEDRSSLIRIRFPGVNTLDDSELVMTMRSHKGDLTQLVLVISMAVFLFCLHGLKVLWPKGFNKGKWFFGSLISVWMFAHVLFLSVNDLKFDEGRTNFIHLMAIRLYLWIMPWASSLFLEQSEEPHQEPHQKYHRFLQHFPRYCNVILCVCPVILEFIWGSLRFPGTLYRLLFLFYPLIQFGGVSPLSYPHPGSTDSPLQ